MVKQEDGSYESTRVIPPGPIKFFFSNFLGPALSEEFKTTHLDIALTMEISGQAVRVGSINTNTFAGIPCDIKDLFSTKPRTEGPSYIPQTLETEFERIVWSIPKSIFKDYKFDTDQKYNDGFEFDLKHTKIPNFVKNKEDFAGVKEKLRKIYKNFRECYKYLSAVGGNEIFSIGSNVLSDFLNQCKIFDDLFSLSDLGVCWNAVNANQAKDQIYNAGNGLCRYEFMEMIVRIANDKFLRKGICQTVSESFEKLGNDHFLPIIMEHDTNKWRMEKYVCEDVDLVLRAHKSILDAIFKRYSGRKALPGQKPFMSIEEYRMVINDANLQSSTFAAREIDICYSQAMMTQIDDLYQKRHLEMNFIEFVEAFSRAADLSNLPKLGEDETMPNDCPIHKRIENGLSYLLKLCPASIKDNFVTPNEETYRRMMYKPKGA